MADRVEMAMPSPAELMIRLGVLLACAVAILAGETVGTARGAPGTSPRCFGAASHDPARPCVNPRLRLRVVPSPSDALIEPDASCAPLPTFPDAGSCWFGVASGQSVRTVALLGDSHSAHWRAALVLVARRLHWYVISLTRSSCPFTLARMVGSDGTLDTACWDYNQALLGWLRGHPEITAVVLSDHPGPVVRRPGQSSMDAHVAGIEAGWNALPATIAHIVPIRDDPAPSDATLACVQRALDARRDAGVTCRMGRSALGPDADLVAARRLRSARVQAVDLSAFFCDRRGCPPVIGGVLVYRDHFAHLTRTYSGTLGPYLLRAIRSLSWFWP